MANQNPYSSNVDNTSTKKPIWKKWWAWLIGIVIIGGIATAGGESEDEDTANNDTTETTVVDKTSTEQAPEPEQATNTEPPKAETAPAQEKPDINPWAKSVVGLSPDA